MSSRSRRCESRGCSLARHSPSPRPNACWRSPRTWICAAGCSPRAWRRRISCRPPTITRGSPRCASAATRPSGARDGNARGSQRGGADDRRRRVARAHRRADRRRARRRSRDHLVRRGAARGLRLHRGRRGERDPGQRRPARRARPADDRRATGHGCPRCPGRGLRDRGRRPDRHGRGRAAPCTRRRGHDARRRGGRARARDDRPRGPRGRRPRAREEAPGGRIGPLDQRGRRRLPGPAPRLSDHRRRTSHGRCGGDHLTTRRGVDVEAAMLIGGEWRRATSSEEIEVVNPATEAVVSAVPAASAADVELAVETAKKAFPAWAATDVEKRAHILAKAADLIEENAKSLASTLTSEQGKPVAEAIGEVNHLAHGVRYYAEAATKVRGSYQELPSAFGPAYGQVIRRPLGVCAAITPYNFPLTLLGTKVAPALACGNTVVAKPAATTPLATLAVARVFAEAGVPDGVLNVVTGRGADIGDALVGHPDVRRIAFTGSTDVGRHVVSVAGPQLKRVTLELGGSDPVIVCEDADVEAAVKAVIIGRYWNAGQACLGCKRVFVHDSVYDDFVSQLVDRVGRYEPGDGTVKAEKPRLRMGPIHTRAGRDELVEQIEDGVAQGGEVLIGGGTGGHDKGWFLEPAVIAEPGDGSRLLTE